MNSQRKIQAVIIAGATGLLPAVSFSQSLAFQSTQPSPGNYIENNLFSVAATGSGLYIGGEGGAFISESNGNQWTYTNPYGVQNYGGWVNAIEESNGSLYVAQPGGAYRSNDNGTSWTELPVRGGANGFSSSTAIQDVRVSDGKIYVAGYGHESSGITVSQNNGISWTRFGVSDGLADNRVFSVFAEGSSIFAGTQAGLSISDDDGDSWSTYTTADGLGSNTIYDIYKDGSSIYAGTSAGLSVSADGGSSWQNFDIGKVRSLLITDTAIFAGGPGGLRVSYDIGATWLHFTTMDGLASNNVMGIAVYDDTVYVAGSGGLSMSSLAPVPGIGSLASVSACLSVLRRKRRRR